MTWWRDQDTRRRAAISAQLDSERGREFLRHSSGDEGFAAWLLVTDVICTRELGLSIFDLADWTWRDAYDSGATPGSALQDALAADDTFRAGSG
jgi:hypothetical protein